MWRSQARSRRKARSPPARHHKQIG
jgi:hypothetical protein